MASKEALVFILFNEREKAVEPIVQQLEARGVSTYFWRRDIAVGEGWEEVEAERLREASAVLVFLGSQGWGPNHRRITLEALRLEKRILPVLIEDPPEGAFEEASGLFRVRRYADLRKPDQAALDLLVNELNRSQPAQAQAGQFDPILSVLIDGSEEERSRILRQVRNSSSIDRIAFAARLRQEIEGRFAPENEDQFGSAFRPPKSMSSIRSWMLSALIMAAVEGLETRELVLRHLDHNYESDRSVRFWALAGLYGNEASYLKDALMISLDDVEPEVKSLAQAIALKDEVIDDFKSTLQTGFFHAFWPVLRCLRVVAIPELVENVCWLFNESKPGSPPAYDSLYALSHPVMAREAVRILAQRPGITALVDRVIEESRQSNPNAIRNFTVVLAAFEDLRIESALAERLRDPETRKVARTIREYLREYRGFEGEERIFVSGYAADSIDLRFDDLGIQEDVQTLTAVMLAKEVTPPLAIGLFGDWGTGKSYFMQSMRKAAKKLAEKSRTSPDPKFCSDIVTIEFNAWHYADTNLWASLMDFILEKLSAHVNPEVTPEQRQADLLSNLGSAKAEADAARIEIQAAHETIAKSQEKLTELQVQRKQKEIRLRDLQVSDLQKLFAGRTELKEVKGVLEKVGMPAALNSVADLSKTVSEAYSLRGRSIALFLEVVQGKNRRVLWLLLAVLILVPVVAHWLYEHFPAGGLLVTFSAFLSEVVAFVAGVKAVLGKAVDAVGSNLKKLEEAKQKVDDVIEEKRKEPTDDEKELQKQIAELKGKEQEAASRLTAASSRALELEEQIRALKEGRSLVRFLTERSRSDDYRKHLGLISTIRRDFDSMADRLANGAPEDGDNRRRVERIVLFIDDLDRCPSEKVMEVLQAVHLLLAYPLFVVVVGVDPRWLLHSLGSTYSAFQADGKRFSANPDSWTTTPQNYLEKIFQIPFNLRPMTEKGYGKLIQRLFSLGETSEPKGPISGPGASAPTPEKSGQAGEVVEKSSEKAPISPAPSPGPDPVPPVDDGRQIPTEEEPDFEVEEESLVIKPWEEKFAEDLFPLIPTPRAAKRFSNTYRILKARVRRESLLQFEGSETIPGDFRVPMLLLAILIGAPGESAKLFPSLQKLAEQGKGGTDALRKFSDQPELKPLEEKIKAIVADTGLDYSSKTFLEWLPRVSRFSFETARALSSN